jgi:hypothetical protein
MAWANPYEFNNYLSQSYGGDSLLISPTTPVAMSGTYNIVSTNSIFGGIGANPSMDISINNYFYYKYRVFKALSISTQITLEQSIYSDETSLVLYNIDQTEAANILVSDNNKIKALFTAELQITGSLEYVFPATVTTNMQYGLFEWAKWLLSGGNDSAYQDRQDGLIRKKVDVLEWEWDKNQPVYSGPLAAKKFLEPYRNPNYIPGIGAGASSFTFN